MTYDVVCDGCRLSYHETAPGYAPQEGVPMKGYDFRLKEPWKSAGWSSFPETADYEYGSLECPGCGATYANGSGFPRLVPREEPHTLFICDECFREFPTEHGMKVHQRTHRVKENA